MGVHNALENLDFRSCLIRGLESTVLFSTVLILSNKHAMGLNKQDLAYPMGQF